MEIIKYLNACTHAHPYEALAQLKEELGIKHSHTELFPELFVLNYDQIDSPKFHTITGECRSLVLEYVDVGNWKVISRSFDRFFNYGETDCGYNAPQLIANEKMDGSLIGIFYHDKYGWLYRTRSMIMPTSSIMGFELTWDDLIEEALGSIWNGMSESFKHDVMFANTSATYICEVTAPENRIVTRYANREMTLLAARDVNGAYWNPEFLDDLACMYGWRRPRRWTFKTMEECAQGAQDLRELQEGYVMYDRTGSPVCKVKNPAYVAAHHLRGEGVLSPKRVINLLDIGEMAEYLSIFPEDAGAMEPYVRAYFQVFAEAEVMWSLYSTVEAGKPFAMKVNKSPVQGLLFRKKSADVDFKTSFSSMTDRNKVGLVEKFLSK